MKGSLIVRLLGFFALSWPTAGQAATNVVLNLNDGLAAGTLRTVISASQAGDTIVFNDNLKGTITLTSGGPLVINKALTIRGPGAKIAAISANDGSRVFVITNAEVSLSGLTITNGRIAGTSGALGNSGIAGTTVFGAGILNWHSVGGYKLTIKDCVFSKNSVVGGNGSNTPFGGGGNGGDAYGGAIFNNTLLALERCTFVENSVSGGNGGIGTPAGGSGGMAFGAGVWNIGAMALTNCTFIRNTASGGNGGATPSGSITFPGNGGHGEGAGVYNAGQVALVSCTIASNSVIGGSPGSGGVGATRGGASGGGIRTGVGVAEIGNCIVADNIGSEATDVAGGFVSRGHNLIGATNGGSGFGAAFDQLGTKDSPLAPAFGTFQDHGGSTPTLALLPISPAIDHGNRFQGEEDQRGAPRPSDFGSISNSSDGSDIGAYELNAPLLNIVRSSDQLLLAWSAFSPGYFLQTTTDLNGGHWVSAGASAVLIGSHFYATNVMSGGSKLFRLSPP